MEIANDKAFEFCLSNDVLNNEEFGPANIPFFSASDFIKLLKHIDREKMYMPEIFASLPIACTSVPVQALVGLHYDSLAAYGFTNSLPVISQAI